MASAVPASVTVKGRGVLVQVSGQNGNLQSPSFARSNAVYSEILHMAGSLIDPAHRQPRTVKWGGQRMLWGLQKAVSLTLSFMLIAAVLGLSQRSMSKSLFLFIATPPLPPPSQSFQMSVSSGASSLTSSPPNTHPNTLQICPIIACAQPSHISTEFHKYCLHQCLFQ